MRRSRQLSKLLMGGLLLLVLNACSGAAESPPKSQANAEPPVAESLPLESHADSIEIAYPAPTGPYPVGLLDFEFTDSHYPMDREEDSNGRRIMVRAWYPAAGSDGERMRFFQGGEDSVIPNSMVDALSPFLPGIVVLKQMEGVKTHSQIDVPPASAPGGFPVLIFSHGGLSWVSQNTAILEELASHGYLVFSVSHPGGFGALIYPDGEQHGVDTAMRDAIFSIPPFKPEWGIDEVFEYRKSLLDDGGLGPWAPRWRDDLIATVDYLMSESARNSPLSDILSQADFDNLGYIGMSYGASAATSAGHVDERAQVAVDFDGTHWLSDLLDTDIRVPLLILASEDGGNYSNQFMYERLKTMGDREDIQRIGLPNVSHMELMDAMFLPPEMRKGLPGGGHHEGQWIHDRLTGFMRDFFDHYLKDAANGYPTSTRSRIDGWVELDVSHVKEWANRVR